ncbi:DUF6094 domain-containing protein [Parachitinimonas caeni]|uniref:DUF6094 domain-containing protein n=1 Tax=Parachitinimonas caeni TaxID=3031301 RepID=A0ABT7E5N1_9NEIS|nr:DUF6094 domain-containing protein [Parachitinimonas caeni]MDK2126760.1 DUF6094 domain-containing protein [Parachitinimonas caeni]
MALMFPRLAQNFIRNGYFPTDEVTLGRILPWLEGGQRCRVLDPCCGEGTALAEVQHALRESGTEVESLGIEFDRERAWHAKQLLGQVVHADIHDTVVAPRSIGLLFLNPPYGQAVSDKAQTGDEAKAVRLETLFLRRCLGMLPVGGVLVLIVPHYVLLEDEMASLLARHFDQLRCFRAPEQRFKQVVIFARKRKGDRVTAATLAILEAFGRGERTDELPEACDGEPYRIPETVTLAATQQALKAIRLEPEQLAAEVQRLHKSTLWPQWQVHLGNKVLPPRAPLRDLRPWHLALALAAGQINGIVRSQDGRRWLIKGDTLKVKHTHVERTEDDKGIVTEVKTLTDRFVPCIRGFDLTPGPSFGEQIEIS